MTSTYFPTDYTGADSNQPLMRFTSRKMTSGTDILNLDLGPVQDSIYLPIPPEGVSTSYKQGWDEKEVNAAQGVMSAFLSKVRTAEPAVRTHPDHQSGKDSTPAGTETTGGVAGDAAIKNVLASAASKLGIQAFTHQAAQQSVVSYTGPAYRDHTFAFQLRPKNAMDSWAIDQIINTFLLTSSPNLVGANQLMRLYEVPAVWEIDFLPNNGLFFLSAAALTSMDVKYGGEKFATFKEGGRPTQVDISLAFKELKILVEDDYKKMLDDAADDRRGH
jgi:hypothetical protein